MDCLLTKKDTFTRTMNNIPCLVRVYSGLSGNFNIYNITSIQDLISIINLKKYKLLHECDVMVENNIIINDNIYDNMDMIIIKITSITDVITELINSNSEYFETEMNKIFTNYGNYSGKSIYLDKLIQKQFNIKFEKDNKPISIIIIDIIALYSFDRSSLKICYDDGTNETHVIKDLSYKNLDIKSWKVPDIINLFNKIFDGHDIYISR